MCEGGGGVIIAYYNIRHVLIDLQNDFDYNTVWTKQRMIIEGKHMILKAWTPYLLWIFKLPLI